MDQGLLGRIGRTLLTATVIASGGCMGAVDDPYDSVGAEGESQFVELGDTEDEVADKGLRTFNGLRTINGMRTINGLRAFNGRTAGERTLSASGFSTDKLDRNISYSGMARSATGAETVRYLVGCALSSGDSVYIGPTRYYGHVGLAPEWKGASCSTACQEKVTGCMLALTNGPGNSVEVELAGQASLGYNHTFAGHEATFFGNIFAASPKAYFCFGSSLYTTRMCQNYEATTPDSCPYFEASGLFCANYGRNDSKPGACDSWNSGTPTRCKGTDGKQYQYPITVYRSGGTRNRALSTARLSGDPIGGAAGQWWRLGL